MLFYLVSFHELKLILVEKWCFEIKNSAWLCGKLKFLGVKKFF